MSEYKHILKEVPLLILANGDKSYIVKTPPYLDSTDGSAADTLHEAATHLFPDLDPHTLRFQASFAGHDRPHTLTEDAYLATLSLLAETMSPPPVLQVVNEKSGSRKRRRSSCSSASDALTPPESIWDKFARERGGGPRVGLFQVYIKTQTGKTLVADCRSEDCVDDLKRAVHGQEGIPPDQQRLVFSGKQLEDGRTLSGYNIKADSTLHMYLRLRAAAASPIALTLSPQWSFSALYPVVDVSKGKQGDSIASWTVSAKPDASLIELSSGLALSYLFWEAHSLLLPPSPPPSPSLTAPHAFDPSQPFLASSNGIALPFSSFLPYLDKTLSSLTLHTAARTDFITYWPPSFNRIHARNQRIAFRFLPQAEYEQAAQLEVDPKPDVVTRVFMLFRGVDEGEAEGWKKPDEVDWVSEVGVKVDEAKDEGLFRVLEWGGMEIVG
ncbi:hypothetical protein JCM8097_003879 [Rhodosporidiobolus ruineniae]